MDFNQYQSEASRTAIYPGHGEITGLMYAALGLGESGEVQGKVKKVLRDNGGILNDESREEIKKELGDILWYVSAMCGEIAVRMEDVAVANIVKLRSRQERGVLAGNGDNR